MCIAVVGRGCVAVVTEDSVCDLSGANYLNIKKTIFDFSFGSRSTLYHNQIWHIARILWSSGYPVDDHIPVICELVE